MKQLISVIVPVYNVEQYLDRCIQSIVDQTYRNLQIILVDDGSPDRSGEICDAWAAKDSRIRVIHQKNAGGGAARNAALEVAQGNFVSMIDSDDYIHPNMYARLVEHMTQDVDIVECRILETYDDNAQLTDSCVSTVTCNALEAMQLHIADRMFCQTPPNKLYRRSTIADVRFPEGIGIDDEYWTYRVIGNAGKLVFLDCPMYAYRQHDGSVMHLLNIPRRLRAVEAKTQRHAYLAKNYPQLLPDSLKNLCFTCLYQGQLFLRETTQQECEHALAYLQQTIRAYPMISGHYSGKDRLWMYLAKHNFLLACRIRNRLGIGL